MSERNPDSGPSSQLPPDIQAAMDRGMAQVQAAVVAAQEARHSQSRIARRFRKQRVKRIALKAYMAALAEGRPRRARG